MDKLIESLYVLLRKTTGITEIPLGSTYEGIGMDSLDLLEFIIKVEDDFDIEINDEDIEELKSIEQLAQLISKEIGVH